jgi:hypothetical protein
MEKWPTVVHASTILEVQTSGCHASLIMFVLHNNVKVFRKTVCLGWYNPNGRAVRGMGLQSLTCWICRFKSHRGHGCLSSVSDVCCQVEVSVSGWSLVQSSPTKCGVSECDHEASVMRRPRPLVAVASWWGGMGGCKTSQRYWGWPFSAVYSSLH